MGKRSKSDPGTTVTVTTADDPSGIPPEAVPASVGDLISAVAASVVPAARAAGPDKFGVEFGIRQRPDGSAQLTDGTAGATFRVFLEWTGRSDG
jgi:hypothetical protein